MKQQKQILNNTICSLGETKESILKIKKKIKDSSQIEILDASLVDIDSAIQNILKLILHNGT